MDVRPGYKQTAIGVVPNEWEVSTVGREFDIKLGKMLDAEKNTGVPKPYLGNRAVQWDRIDVCELPLVPMSRSDIERFRLRKGDLLVCEGGEVGRAAIWEAPIDECYFQKALHRLRPTRGFDPKLMSAILRLWADRGVLANYVTQTSIAHLPREKFIEVPLPVPPRHEQRAIATALSDVDALLGALDRLIAKKRDLTQAAMQQLLTGQTRLPGFHGQWEVRGLLTLAHIAQGQVNPKQEPFRSKYLVGPVHVESGTGKLLNRQTAAEQGAISGKYLFERGDIVYGKINPYLKKAFLAEFQGLCSADMYPLRPAMGVASGYLLAVILGDEFTKYAVSVSVRSGMPKINREEMAGFSARIPKSFAEQTAIAEVLSDMDAEIAALEQRREKTRALKQGMMQELLTGRVRLTNGEGRIENGE